tara:strand:- start:2 stop:724 length:723 start_codon:yes stop_codon:yes gene_type:complete
MKDNFNLKKFLVENKSIENSNPYLKENQYEKDAEADDAEHIDALEKDMADDKKASLRKKVREMIINELGGDPELDYEGASEEEMYGDYDDDEKSYYQHSHKTDIELEEMMDPEDEEEEVDYEEQKRQAEEEAEIAAYLSSIPFEESLDEAKEDEEEEIETDESEDTEEAPEEEVEAEEEETETGGGIEDIAADMKGDEGDLMDHLISALKVSKAMDNDKLTTQIGNTLKFFVGEYIGGEE